MSPSCPISAQRIDSNIVRIISFQVVIFVLMLLYTHAIPFALILLYDFVVRALRKPAWSPFAQIAKWSAKGLGLRPNYSNEAPKRFALYLGLVFTSVLVLLYAAGWVNAAAAVAVILLFCALLETLFDFCIGCKLYYAIQLLGSLKHRGVFRYASKAAGKR